MLKSKHLIFLSPDQIIKLRSSKRTSDTSKISTSSTSIKKCVYVVFQKQSRLHFEHSSQTTFISSETIGPRARNAWNKISAIITCSEVGFTWSETRLVPALCLRSPRVRKRSTPLIIIQGDKSRGEGSLLWGRTTVALPGIPGPRITIWRVQGEGRVKWPPAVG